MGIAEIIAVVLKIVSQILGFVKLKGPSEKAAEWSVKFRAKVDKFKKMKDPFKK